MEVQFHEEALIRVAEVFPDQAMVEFTPLQTAEDEVPGITKLVPIKLVEVPLIRDPQVLWAPIPLHRRSVLTLETSDLGRILEVMMETGRREVEEVVVDEGSHTDD